MKVKKLRKLYKVLKKCTKAHGLVSYLEFALTNNGSTSRELRMNLGLVRIDLADCELRLQSCVLNLANSIQEEVNA